MEQQQTNIQNKHATQMDEMDNRGHGTNDYFEDLANYIIVDGNEKVEQEKHDTVETDRQCLYKPEQSCETPSIGVDDNSEDDEKYTWRPGFCLQLGSQGRRAMLQLLRNVYKADKQHKHIFEQMDPPTTISNLPFFKVSMLWELAHQLGVFKEALAIHKIYGRVKSRVYRNQYTTAKPYYPNCEATRQRIIRNARPKAMRTNPFTMDYDNHNREDERQFPIITNKNMEQLKRNMECLLAVKNVGSDQFMKFMSNFKNKDARRTAANITIDDCGQSPHRQTHNIYDYMANMNTQTYTCNVMDCSIVPQ